LNPKQESFIMRNSIAVTLLGAFVSAFAFLPTPAAAIDARQAFAICDKNPKCTHNTGDDGSVSFHIEQANGQNDVVLCPPRGVCDCIKCRTSSGKIGKVDPIRVLTASSTRTTGAGPKNPRVPSGNILDGGPGFSQSGPSGMGAPAGAPAATPPRGPVLR
jgi:hypothetical protein